MNGVSLSIEGGPELERALAALANEVSDKIAKQAARGGAVVLRNAIKDMVPVGLATHGFHARDQIKIVQPKSKSKGGFTEKGYFEFQVTRGKAFYLDFREFGTKHQQAIPMFRPAFDANQRAAADKVEEVLRAGIEIQVRKSGI